MVGISMLVFPFSFGCGMFETRSADKYKKLLRECAPEAAFLMRDTADPAV